jgi:hypothetical protein
MRSRWPEWCFVAAVGASLAYWLNRAPLATVYALLGMLAVGACGYAVWWIWAKTIEVWKEWKEMQNGQ